MLDLWAALVPLMVASAVLPVPITITILLLRADSGRITAVAWVGGLIAVRLAQGIVFGLVLDRAVATGEGGTDGPGPIASTLLLVVAIAFFASAAAKLLRQPDEDAPPPAWMAKVSAVSPARAFLLGAASTGINLKLWAFTLAAIGVIAEADLGQVAAAGAYLVFVAGALAVHLAVVGIAYLAPSRADAVLARASAGLERHNRTIMIGLGLVFGTWFLLKALDGLGVL
jgi:threonine/homoserine/homoserine lactone efflux protein